MFRTPGAPDEHPGHEADAAFRQGLQQVPVPEVSSDFDARVHAALRRPTPWWKLLWTQVRPVLATAACSLLVTLALLKVWDVSQHPLQPSYTDTVSAESRNRARVRKDPLDRTDLTKVPMRGFATLR